jgi:very-short-patch-repair endonuclease
MTAAETILWRALRDRGVGVKFRRQVPIGPYIADFVCIDAQLIVELDGAAHEYDGRRIYDADRDAWLEARGWRVVRFPNDLVIGGTDIVIARIREVVAAAGPHPSRFA